MTASYRSSHRAAVSSSTDVTPPLPPRLRGYLIALAALAAGAAVHYVGLQYLGPALDFSFILYTLAILLGAWHGYGPGLMATAFVLAVLPFVFNRGFSLSQINLVGLAVFSLVSIVVSRMSALSARAHAALQTLNAQLEARVRQQTTDLDAANHGLEEMLARERHARAEADTANRLKDDFMATLSHELRSPLTAILGWAKLLQSGRLTPPETENALAAIERNSKAQAELIEEVVDLSRITSGKLALDRALIRPADVILAGLEGIAPIAQAKGVDIRRTLDPAANPVLADAGRLQQVVSNLLSNAVKFTPRGGRVHVALTRVSGNAEITVTDNGIGIREDFLPHVFERFRQADASFSRSHGGLGIGLAIVRHLVEGHGGTVSAHSDGEDQGATFRVLLPLASAAETSAAAIAPPASRSTETSDRALHGVRLLVVEDEPDALAMIVTMCRQWGADVAKAASAEEALSILATHQLDVILSDIGMPGQDGIVLMQQVRAQERATGGRRIPALALTGYARPADRDRVSEAGYEAHLAKPVQPHDLLFAVRRLVAQMSKSPTI